MQKFSAMVLDSKSNNTGVMTGRALADIKTNRIEGLLNTGTSNLLWLVAGSQY